MLTNYHYFGSDFDAELDTNVCNATTNCNLTLHMRIYLERYPTPIHKLHIAWDSLVVDADNIPAKVVEWKPNEWTEWSKRLRREAQKCWNGKFWLLTPSHFNELNWPLAKPTHRPNVYCRFRLTITSDANTAHHSIQCVRLAPKSPAFRSHSTLYSHRDLKVEDVGAGKRFRTHLHEVGHLLGLGHSADYRPAQCVKPNDPPCYGVTLPEKLDVMGRGNKIEEWHAQPWRKAISDITETQDIEWGISTKRVFPRKL